MEVLKLKSRSETRAYPTFDSAYCSTQEPVPGFELAEEEEKERLGA